jgi:hypothetical protein
VRADIGALEPGSRLIVESREASRRSIDTSFFWRNGVDLEKLCPPLNFSVFRRISPGGQVEVVCKRPSRAGPAVVRDARAERVIVTGMPMMLFNKDGRRLLRRMVMIIIENTFLEGRGWKRWDDVRWLPAWAARAEDDLAPGPCSLKIHRMLESLRGLMWDVSKGFGRQFGGPNRQGQPGLIALHPVLAEELCRVLPDHVVAQALRERREPGQYGKEVVPLLWKGVPVHLDRVVGSLADSHSVNREFATVGRFTVCQSIHDGRRSVGLLSRGFVQDRDGVSVTGQPFRVDKSKWFRKRTNKKPEAGASAEAQAMASWRQLYCQGNSCRTARSCLICNSCIDGHCVCWTTPEGLGRVPSEASAAQRFYNKVLDAAATPVATEDGRPTAKSQHLGEATSQRPPRPFRRAGRVGARSEVRRYKMREVKRLFSYAFKPQERGSGLPPRALMDAIQRMASDKVGPTPGSGVVGELHETALVAVAVLAEELLKDMLSDLVRRADARGRTRGYRARPTADGARRVLGLHMQGARADQDQQAAAEVMRLVYGEEVPADLA